MKRTAFIGIALTGLLPTPTAGFAQVSCSRDGLTRVADRYMAAQTSGETSGLPLADDRTRDEIPPIGRRLAGLRGVSPHVHFLHL